MKIGLLNTRIHIQQSETVSDKYGNSMSFWKPYFSCFASVSGESPAEDSAEITDESESADMAEDGADISGKSPPSPRTNSAWNSAIMCTTSKASIT